MSHIKAKRERQVAPAPFKKLTEKAIEQVKSVLNIQDLPFIIPGVVVKNRKVSCLFHDEKTPSVTLYTNTNMYNCFGCGWKGDLIKVVMQYLCKSYPEAIELLADFYKTSIEYDENFDAEMYQAEKDAHQEKISILEYAHKKYFEGLHSSAGTLAREYLINKRSFTIEQIKYWCLGYAKDTWQNIAQGIVHSGKLDVAVAVGICDTKNGKNYDVYRNGIIIPIHQTEGQIVGFALRSLPGNDKAPKYINPKNSEVYQKDKVLFGLYQALTARAFTKSKLAYLVEGYFDVISCHEAGLLNTIASCGTAITDEQIKKLKKYVNHVVLMLDSDPAGKESALKNIDSFLQAGFRVELVELPDGNDPDEFIKQYKQDEHEQPINDHIISICQDAVIWKAKILWKKANGIPGQQSTAIKEIANLLFAIIDIDTRTFYIEDVCTQICKADKTRKLKDLQKSISTALDNIKPDTNQDEKIDLSDFSDKARQTYEENGFYALDKVEKGKPLVGFFSGPANNRTTLSNFIVTPHFLIYNGIESRYLLSIYNGYRKSILDVPAKVITSIDQFQGYAVSEGNFLIFANKNQWLRIASDLLQQFPRCIEITRLGWQPFGFFVYLDKVYIPGVGLIDLDNMGMFSYNGENFLVPASCEAYRQLQRIGEDPFENDRCLIYKAIHINFSHWATQMQKVYLDKGIVAVAYGILTIFRDLIFEVDGNCPHLFGFGEPSSGKSKMFESLTALFFFRRPAFNVNSGTDFAFFNYIGNFKNCFAHFNEVDVEVLKDEWFQAMKGWYDGEGRQRGKIGGGKNKTETMKPESTMGGTGQKIIIKDDLAFQQRGATLLFSIIEKSEEQIKDYHILKQWEANGLNSLLTELLEHRALFSKEYNEHYKQQLGYWRKSKADVQQVNQRVLQNWCHLAACYSLISQKIALPQQSEQFTEYCYQQAMQWSTFIHSSDTLSEFWKTIEFLINEQFPKIVYGFDYTVETVMQITIRVSRNLEETINFNQPTKVLFLRLNNVHTLFEMSFRSRKGKEAMSLDNLKHYFSSRKYNLGAIRQKWFSRIIVLNEKKGDSFEIIKKVEKVNSSCHAFLYDELDLNIEKFDGNEPESEAFMVNEGMPFK